MEPQEEQQQQQHLCLGLPTTIADEIDGENEAGSVTSSKLASGKKMMALSSPMRSSLDSDLRPNLLRMSEQYRGMISSIGEDPDRQGLRDTPVRAAKAMMFFTKV